MLFFEIKIHKGFQIDSYIFLQCTYCDRYAALKKLPHCHAAVLTYQKYGILFVLLVILNKQQRDFSS
jgi:hypothetical protein